MLFSLASHDHLGNGGVHGRNFLHQLSLSPHTPHLIHEKDTGNTPVCLFKVMYLRTVVGPHSMYETDVPEGFFFMFLILKSLVEVLQSCL